MGKLRPDFRLVNWGVRIEKPTETKEVLFIGTFQFECPKFNCKYHPDATVTIFEHSEKAYKEESFFSMPT